MRDLTKAEIKWLETKAMPNYLIYSKANEPAYCLNCKAEFDSRMLPTRKIGKEVNCPCCGEKGKIKNKKYTASSWEFGTAIIPDREGDTLILRYFYMTRHFQAGWKEYEVKYSERFREEFDFKGHVTVTDKRHGEDKWRTCKIEYGYYRISNYTHRPLGTHANLPNENVSIFTQNITEYTKGTPMERVPMYKILTHCYFNLYLHFSDF